jgi:hypothetical protein
LLVDLLGHIDAKVFVDLEAKEVFVWKASGAMAQKAPATKADLDFEGRMMQEGDLVGFFGGIVVIATDLWGGLKVESMCKAVACGHACDIAAVDAFSAWDLFAGGVGSF